MRKILNKKGYLMIGIIMVVTFVAGFVSGLYVGRYMVLMH